MKKIVLIIAIMFSSVSMIYASVGCWEEAEQAEAEFCGSVGCNFDYFFAYASQCADGTVYIK